MKQGFGIASVIVVLLAIIAPGPYSLILSMLGLVLAAVGALGGDKVFAVVAPIVAAVNIIFLSPLLHSVMKPDATFWMAAAAFIAAPLVSIALHSNGILRIGEKK